MRAFTVKAACLLFAVALTGCSNMAGTADPPQPIAEDPNPFTYKTVDYPFEVSFAAAAPAPSAAEMKRLQDFLQTASARPGDKVTVSGDNTPLGQTRSAQVRAVLARAGLDPVAGVNVTLGANTVALVLQETVVVAPKCGSWPIFAGDQPSNAPSLFLGCALRNNLYQMVVNKRDLAVGQTPGPADAEPSMRAVQKYREGLSDKKDKGASGGSDDSAADSATGAASAAAGMADAGGTSTTGSSNGQ